MAFATTDVKLRNLDADNFFETTLKQLVTDGTDTNIYLNALPNAVESFLTIEPTVTAKREIIFYNAKGADYVTVPSASVGRGIGGTTAQGHAVSSVVRMSNPAEINEVLRDRIIALNEGWVPADQAWSYASATTITVPSGAASIYSVGDKIKLTQTTAKYFYVTAVADTVLTVTGGTDYTVANAAITSPYYSKMASPVGFPGKFAYTPTIASVTGTLTSYTITKAYFSLNGRIAKIDLDFTITNAGTGGSGISATLPITAANTAGASLCGREIASSGASLAGEINSSDATKIFICKYDGSYQGATNNRLLVSLSHFI